MLLLSIPTALLLRIVAPIGVVLVVLILLFAFRGRIAASDKKRILEAEQQRRAYPDIQTGKFTRLYTMPYYADLNATNIQRYIQDNHPDLRCTVNGDDFLTISDAKHKMNEEIRQLSITHLREENVSAIDLRDPHEVENEGSMKSPNYVMRTSMYDLGFSKEVREVIRHFQDCAIRQK